MFDPGIKTTEPMTIAYLSMKGDFSQIPDSMGRLYGTIARMGLHPAGMPMTAYLNDPSEVPESEALWELWAPVAGAPEPRPTDDEGFGIRAVPAEKVAFAIHKGPYELIGEVYDRLMGWLSAEGHIIVGVPREMYLSDPNETAPEDYLTEVQLPIA